MRLLWRGAPTLRLWCALPFYESTNPRAEFHLIQYAESEIHAAFMTYQPAHYRALIVRAELLQLP